MSWISDCIALPQSPETEVADMLRTLGDHVNEEFSEILSQAVAAVLPQQAADNDIPYAALQSAAESLIAHVHPGWSQVLMAVCIFLVLEITSGYATWFTAGAEGAICIAHYDVIDDGDLE